MKSIHNESEFFFQERENLLISVTQHQLFHNKPSMFFAVARCASSWSIKIILKHFNIFKFFIQIPFHSDKFEPQIWSIINKEGSLINMIIENNNTYWDEQEEYIVDHFDYYSKTHAYQKIL